MKYTTKLVITNKVNESNYNAIDSLLGNVVVIGSQPSISLPSEYLLYLPYGLKPCLVFLREAPHAPDLFKLELPCHSIESMEKVSRNLTIYYKTDSILYTIKKQGVHQWVVF